MTPPPGHFTPSDLMAKYPHADFLNWNAMRIGIFLSSGLLLGPRLGKHRTGYVSDESFNMLMDYADGVLIKLNAMMNDSIEFEDLESSTPHDLMLENPRLRLAGWNASKIGVFYESALLLGNRSGSEHKAHILDSSFKELIQYRVDLWAKVHRRF